MRPKTGLPKRKALRTMPKYRFGFKDNPINIRLRSKNIERNKKIVSLFSGCGGLDLGILGGFRYGSKNYENLPFELVAAIDNDKKAVETYNLNLPTEAKEQDLTATDMSSLPASDVLIGGFPCQDFSSSGLKLGFEGKRGRLYRIMTEYMAHHQPKVVVAENVPHLLRMNKGAMLEAILSEFEDAGYDFRVWNLNCPDYGLPQNRKRLFMVGVRRDLPGEPEIPLPLFVSRHRPIEWAIEDLIDISDESVSNQGQYFVATKATAGAGQGDQVSRKGKIAYCVRANAKARIHFHYELDRRLTVRECARLQSFPDEFVFPHSTGSNMMQIGNAVPPIVAHHVGCSLATYFSELELGQSQKSKTKYHRSQQLSLQFANQDSEG